MRIPLKQFTIRVLLTVTTSIAIVFAWGVSSYREWHNERAAIDRLNGLSYWKVFEISQDFLDQLPDDGGFNCGSVPPGVEMVHDSTLPNFLAPIERRFGINMFQRVTRIGAHRACDPGIVAELPNFQRLQKINFNYSPVPPKRRLSTESEFLGAIKLFASLKTNVTVTWPEDPVNIVAADQATEAPDQPSAFNPEPAFSDPFGN